MPPRRGRDDRRTARVDRRAPRGWAPSAWCRRWARCTRATRRLIERARRECGTRRRQHLRQPAAVRSRRRPRALSAPARGRPRALCGRLGVDMVFAPTPAEMYPAAARRARSTSASIADAPRAAAFRPGHFDGVATVVLKLLRDRAAGRAYFGEKDAQQLAIVRRMVADLNVPVAIVGVPTVREPTAWRSARATSTSHAGAARWRHGSVPRADARVARRGCGRRDRRREASGARRRSSGPTSGCGSSTSSSSIPTTFSQWSA